MSKESDLAKWRDLRDKQWSRDPEVVKEATAQAEVVKKRLYEEHHVVSPDVEAPPSRQPWMEPGDRDRD